MQGREHQRQRQDQAERGKRRPSDEVVLSNAMDRYRHGTYLRGS